MRRLSQVLNARGPAGVPLPEILPSLSRRHIRFRRAQVVLVAAQPNGGKSMLALWYAVKSGLRTMYMSADTDPDTTTLRAAAIKMGRTYDEVEQMVRGGGAPLVEDALLEVEEAGLEFSFRPSPSLEAIDLEVLAYEEAYGCYPDLIVIDNLMNVMAGTDNEWQGMRETMSAMHLLARATDACVLVLHHVSESEYRPASKPASRRAIQGKVSQLPELILTVAIEPRNGIYRVACVKNRHGEHDPTGEDYATCYVDAPRMTLFDSLTDMQMAASRREWA